MKLHYSPLSPYARKARIIARIHALDITEVVAKSDLVKGYAAQVNPLGKVPALELEDGTTLFDSPVICEYLDALARGGLARRGRGALLPADGEARWEQLRLHAVGDGLSDAVYNYRQETVREKPLHWQGMIARHNHAMHAAIAYLEAQADALSPRWSFGNIAIICALDYMDFRASHIDWREAAPKLALWHKAISKDAAYRATDAYPRD